LKRSSWSELLILPVSLSGLSVCWLVLWVHWLLAVGNLQAEPTIAPWLMLLMLVVGTFVTRWAVAAVPSNIDLNRPQRIIVVSGLVAVTAVLWLTFGGRFPFGYFGKLLEWKHFISAELLALIIAGLLWWRAIYLGRDEDLHASAQREFSGGIVALAVLFVFNQANPQLDTAEAFWPILIFFALGLGSLALAGFEQDRQIQGSNAGTGLGVNRHWLGTVGAIIGLILVGAVMMAAIASPQTIAALDPILTLIGVTLINIIGTLIYWAALIILPIGELIGRALWPILQFFVGLSANFQLRSLGPTPEQINDVAQQLARTPPFRVIEIALILLVLIIVFRLAVRRWRLLKSVKDEEETHESVFSQELLWDQLKQLFTRRTTPAKANPPPYLALEGVAEDPRLIVRQAYQTFLAWAKSNEQERLPHQTPAMLGAALSETTPQFKKELATLTQIYTQARYGQAVSKEEAAQAQEAVQGLLNRAKTG
jgi:Domain of unknown function (DUF4129)